MIANLNINIEREREREREISAWVAERVSRVSAGVCGLSQHTCLLVSSTGTVHCKSLLVHLRTYFQIPDSITGTTVPYELVGQWTMCYYPCVSKVGTRDFVTSSVPIGIHILHSATRCHARPTCKPLTVLQPASSQQSKEKHCKMLIRKKLSGS
jgi:hypothetical protein